MQRFKLLSLVIIFVLIVFIGGCSKPVELTEVNTDIQNDEPSVVDNQASEIDQTDKLEEEKSTNDIDPTQDNTTSEAAVEEGNSKNNVLEISDGKEKLTDSKKTVNSKGKSTESEKVDSSNETVNEEPLTDEPSGDNSLDENEENKELSEEDIKFADKVKAFKLAATRLTGDQISELMDMAKGGFTAEEKERAKELFYKNFTDEEREWILDMYEKYY